MIKKSSFNIIPVIIGWMRTKTVSNGQCFIPPGNLSAKKFLIIPASQELWNTKQIEYTQIATVVAASLSSQGYTQVKDEKLADQVILLNFLRSGPFQILVM